MTCPATDNPYYAFDDWLNSFVFGDATRRLCVDRLGRSGHFLMTYCRYLLAATLFYYLACGLWHVYVFHYLQRRRQKQRRRLVTGDDDDTEPKKSDVPTARTICAQVWLSQKAMFVNAGFFTLSEALVESGWTRVYYTVGEVGGGWATYLASTVVYLALVEVGIYWMHRALHENKFLYSYIHSVHHKYNKPSTLSPWASAAFQPLDGFLQALPYCVALLVVPCHHLTHMVMLVSTALWTTAIHEVHGGDGLVGGGGVVGGSKILMGSKYHLIHHTHGVYNLGQFFTFCDAVWGTLASEPPAIAAAAEAVGGGGGDGGGGGVESR